jgi:hypothetical protein
MRQYALKKDGVLHPRVGVFNREDRVWNPYNPAWIKAFSEMLAKSWHFVQFI